MKLASAGDAIGPTGLWGERRFRTDDPDFPTTPAVQRVLAAQGRVVNDTGKLVPAGPAPPSQREDGEARTGIVIGKDDRGSDVVCDLDRLLGGRALLQGSSGAGKSWLLRRIIEQAHGFVTTIILDPEGDFGNLAQHIGAVTVRAGEIVDTGLTGIAVKARKHRIPLHIDLSDLEADVRIAKAAAFLSGLMSVPREDWENTCLLAIDEAHLLAPHVAASSRDAEMRRLGVATLTDVCARGRKRGLSTLIATQRLAKLATSVLAELHNFMIGMNVLDRDIARAADLLGYSYDKGAMLRELKPGEFLALGPALRTFPTLVKVASTATEHLGKTPCLRPSAGYAAAEAETMLNLPDLHEAAADRPKDAKGTTGSGNRMLDSFLLEPSASVAARIVSALIPISPHATTSANLSEHLGETGGDVDQAIDLLSRIGVVDTMPRDAVRIVRLSSRMRLKSTQTQVVGLG